MNIILVHWLIKEGKQDEFVNHWKYEMRLGKPEGFYREILTTPVSVLDPKYNTFSVTDKNYETFINVAIWESVDHFDKAMKPLLPKADSKKTDGKVKQVIELEDFEFKIRERVVLKWIDDRGVDLPEPTFVDPPDARITPLHQES